MKHNTLFKQLSVYILICLYGLVSCTHRPDRKEQIEAATADTLSVLNMTDTTMADTVFTDTVVLHKTWVEKVKIKKEYLYDNHSLGDTYPYKDTVRVFQWTKIKRHLARIDSLQSHPQRWGVLQNYKNRNGEAPLVKNFHRNAYRRISDSLEVERYQSVPLYSDRDSLAPELYGRDGSLVKVIDTDSVFVKIIGVSFDGNWSVPVRYVKHIADTVVFYKTVFVDVTNQNITTLEKKDSVWLVRSMNPATTGMHKPPYMQETPLGLFVIQEHKPKMIYLQDGKPKHGGFAPYASRFTNGGYIHGVPVNVPHTEMIEYSPSLGTTPRSHMCVRNATSHARFIYEWAPPLESLVFVID